MEILLTPARTTMMQNTADPTVAAVLNGFEGKDLELVNQALTLMRQYTAEDEKSLFGQNLREHLLQTAALVNQLDLMAEGVAATLLYALPTLHKNWKILLKEHGVDTLVIGLVEGVDEIQKLTEFARIDALQTPEDRARQAETMRKMLLAMVSDIRVVIIKLAMRSRNLEYLATQEDSPMRRAVAKETMEIFAPLANRLGIWQLKWILEDLGFRFQNPEAYSRIAKLLDEKRSERLAYIDNVVATIKAELGKQHIPCEVAGRPKHIYSIYKKMVKKKVDFSGLYDIRAVRVLVNTIPECYTTLGVIHSMWQPISGEFDDYISHPKANDYRSLHTVVVGPEDKGVEIQIRTFAMHEFAEFGVAAHWRYKEGGQGDAAYEQKIAWLRQLLDWRENMADADKNDLAAAFQTELFKDTIYVLTPHGKVLSLPAGATPIDFAYALHTSIGDRCRGAKVDGQIVPLSTTLENGQRVEIITVKEGHPSVNWLHEGWVKSQKAITKIRAYIRAQNSDAVREEGRLILDKHLARLNPKPNLHMLTERLHFARPEDLFSALGHGEITVRAVDKILTDLSREAAAKPLPSDTAIVRQSRAVADKNGVLVNGEAGLMTVLARCCKPAPPDAVVGFVTRGRGVSIHRQECPEFKRLAQISPEKVLAASWAGQAQDNMFPIDINIQARDRNGLLRDISDTFSRNKFNVVGVHSQTRDGVASMRFTVEIRQSGELPKILAQLGEIKDILNVYRG